VKTWVRVALIVVCALVLWWLVIDLTKSVTSDGAAQAPAAPAAEAPARAAPGQTP
jgi:hypothetical protein